MLATRRAFVPAGADVPASVISTHAYPCHQCGSQATWHPERREVACAACGAALELPAARAGAALWFPLVDRLRDAPENRRTWTPAPVDVACPSCGGALRFPGGHSSKRCEACGTPVLRGEAPGDAPLAPDGVVPFDIGDADAEQRLRTWAAARDGGRLFRATVEIIELRRTYLPYWQFITHVHCPFRGTYLRKTRDGHHRQTDYGGEIDEPYDGVERGFTSVERELIEALEPMPLDEAVPYEPRYLTGATVEQYSVGLWDAWDAVRGRIDAQIDRLLRMAGDGHNLPDEVWPTWSQQRGRLILVPVHVATCVSLDRMWPALVHGTSGKVVGKPPVTRRDRIITYGLLSVLLAIVGGVGWLLYRLVSAYPPAPLW